MSDAIESPRLPDTCMAVHPDTGDLIHIHRGEQGYYVSVWNKPGKPAQNRRTAAYMNKKLQANPAQQAAMLAGSLFGWDAPGADPRNYNADGTSRQPKQKALGR